MRVKDSEEVARRVCQMHEKKFDCDRKKTRDHFIAEGMHRTTINRILDRFEDRENADYIKPSGRPAVLATKKVLKKVEKAFTTNPCVSERAVAASVHLSHQHVHHIKANKLGFKTYKAQTAPKYTEGQKKRAKTNCRKIYEKLLKQTPPKLIVMDDETYCTVDPESINGIKFYSCKDKNKIPDKYKFKAKEKFPKKYLIWLAIDEHGAVSKPLIISKTLNSQLYLKDCVKKRLMPFIKNKQVLFWPDMATSHYAKIVTDYFEKEKVDFVKKVDNAPNVPQARPIERFWAYIKQQYSKRKDPPKNLRGFQQVLGKIIQEVAKKHGATLMARVRQKLRKIGREGVLAVLKDKNK